MSIFKYLYRYTLPKTSDEYHLVYGITDIEKICKDENPEYRYFIAKYSKVLKQWISDSGDGLIDVTLILKLSQ